MKHIFLISQPRAGSTFLQRILSNHSKIHTEGEPWFLLPVFKGDFDLKVLKKTMYNKEWTNNAVSEFFKVSEDFNELFFEYQILLYKNICKSNTIKNNCDFFLDKTPRYYYIIDELSLAFPDSKIVVLIRNPLDVFNSILDTWIKNCYPLLNDYQDDLFRAPIILRELLKSNINNNIIFTKYEDLLRNSAFEIKRICSFIGIDYEEQLLDISKSQNWKLGDPKMNLKNKIDSNNYNVWKRNLTFKKWSFFNQYIDIIGDETFNDLGYDIVEIRKALYGAKPEKEFSLFEFQLSFYFRSFSINILRPIYLFLRKHKLNGSR